MITLANVQAALERIRPSIYLSPCTMSVTFSQLTGNSIYLKLDNLQRTGAGFDLVTLREITVQELQQQLAKNGMQVLDVRREAEFMAGHIEEAAWWPLDRFRISPPEVDLNVPLAVHCQSGYRSMIACSLLQRAGFKNVVNVSGGFGAWQEAKLPVATGAPVEA